MATNIEKLLVTVLALAVPLGLGMEPGWAAVQYLNDGARQSAAGGWDLPTQATCTPDATKATRPECLALRIVAASSAACTTAQGSWTTGGVCNDLVNATQAACEARPDRLWNSGTGICAVVMKGDDRNRVVCANHGGTWVTAGTCQGAWVFPSSSTYTPPLFTGTTNPGPGDQCLRCHNSVTEYNGPRLRDVNWALRQGHKNMARMVTPDSGLPWAGPGYECSVPGFTNRTDCEAHMGTWDPSLVIYPSDDSDNAFDWPNGDIWIGGIAREVAWIFGDWLTPLPRAVAKLPASSTQVCSDPRYSAATCVANGGTLLNNAGASYSCARCHTTGWTSDAAINAIKEPERSFPGITWDRNTHAGFGVVNMSGGVTGDANKYASFDAWGITCSRCHSSAVDNSTNGGVPPFSAPTAMSSHHSNMTVPDFPAACTVSGQRSESACMAAGGTWNYGYCTDSRFLIGTSFAASRTACQAGPEPAAGMGVGVWITPCSDNNYGSQASCQAAGATWTLGTSSCSLPGVCNKGSCSDPTYLNRDECEDHAETWTGYDTQAACQAVPGGQWAAASDIITCEDAGGHWTGTYTQRGPIITALCMNCHRQETGGFPYDSSSPAGSLKVGPAHGTVAFVSHPHGNQFLNSPHGKFTGTFSQIATGKFNFAMTGEYRSFFQTDGEAANTGNGCTGCHNVHKSVVEEAFEPAPEQEGAIHEECTVCHAKSLNLVMHPSGPGTPLEEMAEEPYEACVACHMPEGMHLWRINVDPSYSTLPAGALTTTVNANAAPDGTYTNAVWADLDHACGQCHGGGTNQATTTGSISAGSKILTVAATTGFAAGQRIQVADAGALDYDDEGLGRGDFETYIVSVAGPGTINLAGAPSMTVVGKSVVQNPVKNGAGYIAKTDLAVLAAGIHNDKPLVTFGTTLGSPDTMRVNTDASATTCSGELARCDAFEWSWGDGTTGSGAIASHTYTTAGAYTVELTVEEFGVGGASSARSVTVYAPDLPPTVAGTCSFNADTWTETVMDASTDDAGVKQVVVNWGDGSILAVDSAAPFGPFSRTYLNPGTYTITHKALDTIGQQSTRTCMVTPAFFFISGTVLVPGGGSPLSAVTVQVKKGTQVIRTVYTAANGTFLVGSLKPGAYTLTMTKPGYTFAVPAATLAVGPSSPGNTITATGPLTVGSGRELQY